MIKPILLSVLTASAVSAQGAGTRGQYAATTAARAAARHRRGTGRPTKGLTGPSA